MLTINKKIKITAENSKVEFDLENKLPEGEYEAQLVVNDKVPYEQKNTLYALKEWSKNGIKFDKPVYFNREDMYDNGSEIFNR